MLSEIFDEQLRHFQRILRRSRRCSFIYAYYTRNQFNGDHKVEILVFKWHRRLKRSESLLCGFRQNVFAPGVVNTSSYLLRPISHRKVSASSVVYMFSYRKLLAPSPLLAPEETTYISGRTSSLYLINISNEFILFLIYCTVYILLTMTRKPP